MKVVSIKVENKEQIKALKAISKVLKMEFLGFTDDVSDKTEKQRILDGIAQGYKESLEIEAGRMQGKPIEQLLDEL